MKSLLNNATANNINKMTVGIIGYGPFGKTIASVIAPHRYVKIFSRRQLPSSVLCPNSTFSDLGSVARCDVVVLSNELSQFENDCRAISKFVKPDTIVMDVCSVKVRPCEVMKNVLGGRCRLLATHPLFGPQSIDGTNAAGMTIVWHEIEGTGFDDLRKLFEKEISLIIKEVDPDIHDREMAWVHGLSFFIGRGLLNIELPMSDLTTNYYSQLVKLHDIEKEHSLELFRTIQLANPYTSVVRKKFLHALENLENDLENTTT